MALRHYFTANGALIGQELPGGAGRVDFLTDALGSVTATVGQTASVQNTYRYKPYGAQLSKTGSGTDPNFSWLGCEGLQPTSLPTPSSAPVLAS